MYDLKKKQALYELVCHYAQAVDRRDWAQLTKLFTADASVKGPGFSLNGRDSIVEGMGGLSQYTSTQHHVHHQIAKLEEQSATAETYCVANHVYARDGVSRKLDWGIRYHDRFVCEAGEWRFAERVLLLDWAQDLPLEI